MNAEKVKSNFCKSLCENTKTDTFALRTGRYLVVAIEQHLTSEIKILVFQSVHMDVDGGN